MGLTTRPLLTLRQRDALRSLTELVVAAVELVGTGGLITIDDLVPGVRQFLRGDDRGWDPRKVSRAIQRATRRRLIVIRTTGRGPARVELTERGQALLAQRQLEGCAVTRPRRWDGRWRVLIFDVPEKRKHERDALRKMLQRLGFRYLQRSVWVYPFDCAEIVALLRAATQLSHVIARSLIVTEIEDDEFLRRHFDL